MGKRQGYFPPSVHRPLETGAGFRAHGSFFASGGYEFVYGEGADELALVGVAGGECGGYDCGRGVGLSVEGVEAD